MHRETARSTALIIIDMQNDFLHPEGLFSSLGYNVTEMRELNPTIHNVLELSPERGLFVVHTRQGWRADLSDLPSAMRGRSKNGETEFGSPGPMGLFLVHDEKRHDIVQEFQPREDNTVVDKVGSGAFCGTDSDLILRCRNLVFTGTSTDACIHSANRPRSKPVMSRFCWKTAGQRRSGATMSRQSVRSSGRADTSGPLARPKRFPAVPDG